MIYCEIPTLLEREGRTNFFTRLPRFFHNGLEAVENSTSQLARVMMLAGNYGLLITVFDMRHPLRNNTDKLLANQNMQITAVVGGNF